MTRLAFVLLVLLPLSAAPQTAKETWLINGQVLDENGKPVIGAGVQAHPDALKGRLPMSVTDSDGHFTIQVRKAGRYRVGAYKFSQDYASTLNPFFYPATAGTDQVTVQPDGPPPFIAVRFGPRAGKLKLHVIDRVTGKPVPEIQISQCRADAPRHCYRQNLSALDGVFLVLASSDRVFVQVYASGYNDWYAVDERENQPEFFTTPSNTTTAVNVLLTKRPADNLSQTLKAPDQLSPEYGTELVRFPRTTELAWAQVAGAASYTVEIDLCDGTGIPNECKTPYPVHHMDMSPTSGIEGTTYKFAGLGAQPFRWRVWAIDKQGRLGVKSDWSVYFYRW